MATRCGNYGFTFILRCLACGAIIQVETAIRDGCAIVSQTFLHLADRQNLFDGSTAVFMLRRENTIWVANIGDSRGVLLTSSSSSKPKSSSASPSCKACFMRRQIGLRCADCKQRKQTPKTTILPQTGRFRHSPEAEAALVASEAKMKALPLTIDHKPSVPSEKKRIIAAGGKVHSNSKTALLRVNGKLAISRTFGDRDFKQFGVTAEPDITRRELHEGDEYVILATDGVWDSLSNTDMLSRCRKAISQCRRNPFETYYARMNVDDDIILATRDVDEKRPAGVQSDKEAPKSLDELLAFEGAKAVLCLAAEDIALSAIEAGSDDNVTALLVDVGGKLACSLSTEPLKKLVEKEISNRSNPSGSVGGYAFQGNAEI